MDVTIRQGRKERNGWASSDGASVLREVAGAQQSYLMYAYTRGGAGKPYGTAEIRRWVPSRTRGSLRRIASIARNQARGLPAVRGVLFAAGDWRMGIGGILLLVPNEGTDTLIITTETAGLVERKPIYVSGLVEGDRK